MAARRDSTSRSTFPTRSLIRTANTHVVTQNGRVLFFSLVVPAQRPTRTASFSAQRCHRRLPLRAWADINPSRSDQRRSIGWFRPFNRYGVTKYLLTGWRRADRGRHRAPGPRASAADPFASTHHPPGHGRQLSDLCAARHLRVASPSCHRSAMVTPWARQGT